MPGPLVSGSAKGNILGVLWLYEISTFYSFFLHFSNVFFSVESENDIVVCDKPIGKKLFNVKVTYDSWGAFSRDIFLRVLKGVFFESIMTD